MNYIRNAKEIFENYLVKRNRERNREEVDNICDKNKEKHERHVSKKMLEKIFGVTITTGNKQKYKKRFFKNCTVLTNLYLDSKYIVNYIELDTIYDIIPKEYNINNKSLEILINTISFFTSLGVVWTTYLFLYSGGRKLILDVFNKTTLVKGLINILSILIMVHVSNSHDELLFSKSVLFFLDFLPSVNIIRDSTYFDLIMTSGQAYIAGKIASTSFIKLLENIISDEVKKIEV